MSYLDLAKQALQEARAEKKQIEERIQQLEKVVGEAPIVRRGRKKKEQPEPRAE